MQKDHSLLPPGPSPVLTNQRLAELYTFHRTIAAGSELKVANKPRSAKSSTTAREQDPEAPKTCQEFKEQSTELLQRQQSTQRLQLSNVSGSEVRVACQPGDGRTRFLES